MDIRINGKTADITLETEKTVGEVLSGIQNWLEESELFVSALELDGKTYGAGAIDGVFSLGVEGISVMEIRTSGWAELLLEALVTLRNDLEFYEQLPQGEQQECRKRWEHSVPALFLAKNAPDIHNAALKTLDTVFSAAGTIGLIAERIRELEKPREEMAALKPLVDEIAKRLEDLPLDVQTGKDAQAAETITLFSGLTEKIFRLLVLFKHFGTNLENIEVSSMDGTEKLSLKVYIEEFSAALKEFIAAYENSDTVLAGDLAEYELAPRLRFLASALYGINAEEGK
ncbi:hypothetical protein AGMMS50230_22220 [Spirochaetia bacterium]|nr:hypothetical protein AGMMS50230_22220 [Spirochaetia bacterium]